MMVHSCDYKHRVGQKNFGGGARTLSLKFVDVWNIPNVCLLLLEMRRASVSLSSKRDRLSRNKAMLLSKLAKKCAHAQSIWKLFA